MNILSSLLILIAIILSILVFISLIGWWRGIDSILFPGIGIVAAMPAVIVFLLILGIFFVIVAAVVKPKKEFTGETRQNFEYPNDIFNGCGNGTLTVSLSKNPENYEAETDRGLKVCINYEDLDAIHDVVIPNRTKYEEYKESENYKKIEEENRKLFQKFALKYPMISRIDDMYKDYVFTPQEIVKLREECLTIKSIAVHPSADLALRKLIYACEEALKGEFYLEFSGD